MKSHYSHVRLLFMGMLCAGLAQAQAISPNPDKLALTADSAGQVQSQTINITSTGTPLLLNLSVTTYNTGNWLYASPGTVSTPAAIIVSVNATQLPAGVYNGEIIVSAAGATNSPVVIPVSLSVGTSQQPGGTGLAVTPSALNFIGQAGGVPPSSQQLGITSTPPGTTFTVTSSTTDNGNWLQVTSNILTAPATVLVNINTAGMSAGVYSGLITLSPTTGTATTVPVTLTLGGGSMLSVSASSLQFFYQMGWFLPTYQTFDVSSSGSPLSFSVVTSTNNGVSWLSATPSGGNTKQTITVSVVPGLLGAGTYTGKITVSSTNAANNTVEIPVNLTISNSPLLTVGPTPVPFVYQTGGSAPAAQSLAIGSSSSSISFAVATSTADGNPWLGVTPMNGTTPQNLTVVVSPGNLSPGTYSGTISVTSAGASNSPLRIPITMTVSSVSALTLSVPSLNLNYQINGQSQVYAQQVGVYSTGQPVTVNVTAAVSSCAGNWLKPYQTALTTPQVITIGFDPIQLTTPGTCQGAVTFTPAAGGTAATLPVTVTVATTPLMNLSPVSLNFTAPFDGDPAASQTVNVAMTDTSAVVYTATASTTTGGSWIRMNAGPGTTPGAITVSADPTNLGVGSYTGNIVVGSPALTVARTIPVTFKVTATDTVNVSPQGLSFTQAAGGPLPTAKSITITSAKGAALAYAVSTSTLDLGGWLSATPNSGNTPAALSVTANGSALAPGTYQGTVTLSIPAAANSPITIPVTLVITTGQTVSASPTSLSFTYRIGGTVPAGQSVSATSTAAGVNVTSSSTSTGNWLSITPVSNTTPTVFTVNVAPGGLTPNTYNGTVTLTAPGAVGSPINIPVTLEVQPASSVSISKIANAASGERSAISPGEIVMVNGANIGPTPGVPFSLTPAGTVDTTLASTRVFFDEFPAPLLYVSAGQINAIVPYEIAGRQTVQVAVEYQGTRSDAYTMQVAGTAPGIFTATQTGRGQGAILNQDNGYNSADLPAARGSVVQVFGTGEGVVVPAAQTGSVTMGIFTPAAKVTATVGGIPAPLTFAGAAPQQVAGLFQVNVTIPQNAPVGDVPILITFGNLSTQSGVTVAVK